MGRPPYRALNLEHRVLMPRDRHHAAADWCLRQWGSRWDALSNREGLWCTFWRGTKIGDGDDRIYERWFKNEQDAVLFALRWA